MGRRRATTILNVSSGVVFDTDAIAFMTVIGIGNDSTLYFNGTQFEKSGAQIWTAINNLVLDLKGIGPNNSAHNFWSRSTFLAFYPYLGFNTTSAKWNLRNPADTDSAFRIVWSGTIATGGYGVKSNSTNGYGDTKIVPSTHASLNDFTMGFYENADNAGSEYKMGMFESGAQCFIRVRPTGNNTAIDNGLCFASAFSNIASPWSKIVMLSRINSTTVWRYSNTGDTSHSVSSSGRSSSSIVVLGTRSGGTVNRTTSETCNDYFLGGLTPTEAGVFKTILIAFNTALGRN